MAAVYIIMGVSGCGKTTVGEALAATLNIPFYDADDYHLPSNIIKMASGTPLEDEDRWPWLDILAVQIRSWQIEKGAVLACSALKEIYRERLFRSSGVNSEHAFAKAKQNIIFLNVSFEAIQKRLDQRKNHFFDPKLLRSQFDTLEVPAYGIHVDAGLHVEVIVEEILKR